MPLLPTRPPLRRSSAALVVPDFALAAVVQRLLEGTLALGPGQKLVVVTDKANREVALTLTETAGAARILTETLLLDELAPRPHYALDARVRQAMAGAQASLLLVKFEKDEMKMRAEIVEEAKRLGIRHGHIVGVRRGALISGLSVDPRRIAALAGAIRGRLQPSSKLRIRSAAGTDLVVQLEKSHRWVEYSGIVAPGGRANLPAGELVTSPGDVEGVFVADGSLGDSDGELAQLLDRTPLTLRISRGRVRAIEGRDGALARRIDERIKRPGNLDRVGLAGFGTNVGMTSCVGDVFADQKIPGFHLSLGFPFPKETGATWDASSWVAFTSVGADVDVDGAPIMRAGRYLVA